MLLLKDGKMRKMAAMKRKKMTIAIQAGGGLAPIRTSVWVAVVCRASCRVLLAERAPTTRNSGQWNFFGGGVDAGERPVRTAIRELKEEGGIVVSRHDLVPVGEALTPTKRNILFALLVDDEFAPILNGESVRWQWVALDDLPFFPDLHLPTSLLIRNLESWAIKLPRPVRPASVEADTVSRVAQSGLMPGLFKV